MSKATGTIAVGDTVTLGDSNMGTLWLVLDFELRVGGVVFAKITPLGGGMTMKTSAERLTLVTRAGRGMSSPTDADVEAWCEIMHDAYEAAAVGAGWETQQSSRKPWADVPEANKATMRAAVRAVAPAIAALAKTEALRDMADDPRVTCTKCATELNLRADHIARADEIEAGR